MASPEQSDTPSPDHDAGSFDCLVEHNGRGAVWVRLCGELDLTRASRAGACLDDALGTARLTVVDLRLLTFIDSTGLGVLVAARHRAAATDCRLVLVRGPSQVDRLLDITGLSELFEFAEVEGLSSFPIGLDAPPPA